MLFHRLVLRKLERVTATVLKKHDAEALSQTAIECALQLRAGANFSPAEIQHVDTEIFDVADHIIGG